MIVSQTTCSHCASYKPKLEDIANEYKIKMGVDEKVIDKKNKITKCKNKKCDRNQQNLNPIITLGHPISVAEFKEWDDAMDCAEAAIEGKTGIRYIVEETKPELNEAEIAEEVAEETEATETEAAETEEDYYFN